MTLVTTKQEEFERLEDERLGWACMEPFLLRIRGKDMAVKTVVVSGLNPAQKALFMFRVLFDHAKHSAGEYYAWVCQLLDTQDYWRGVTGGMRFFGDAPMLQLLDETKACIESRTPAGSGYWRDSVWSELERDETLRRTAEKLYGRFMKLSEDSHAAIAAYIRSHPGEFVHFEGAGAS